MNVTAEVFQSLKSPIRLKLNEENKRFDRRVVISTGISIHRIWEGKKYFVVEYYSQWVSQSGGCRGTYFIAYEIGVDNSEILSICEKVGINPASKIDEQAEEI